MLRVPLLVLVSFLVPLGAARAILDETSNPNSAQQPNESVPTNITNWTTGWTQPTVQPTGYTSTTGWNYCGTIGGNSAVYLGNGWVLTAAHVGAADLSLNNVNYPMVPNSAHVLNSVQVSGQAAPTQPQADLVLFQVSPCPSLPPLVIRPNDPVGGSSQVVMLGYGQIGPNGTYRVLSWGFNTVTSPDVNYPVTISHTVNNVTTTYYTNDFVTLTQDGTSNNYQVIEGDSGGPDFIYNSTTKAWELAGLNEAMLSNNGNAPFASAMIQLDTYLPQIKTIMAAPADSPTLPQWGVGLLAASLVAVGARTHLPSKASSKG